MPGRRVLLQLAAILLVFALWSLIGPHFHRHFSRSVTTDNLQHLRLGQVQAVTVAKSCDQEGTLIDEDAWPALVEHLNTLRPAFSGRARGGPFHGGARPLVYFLKLKVATGTVSIFLETPWAMNRSKVVAAVSGPLGPLDYYDGDDLAAWAGVALRTSRQLGGSQKP